MKQPITIPIGLSTILLTLLLFFTACGDSTPSGPSEPETADTGSSIEEMRLDSLRSDSVYSLLHQADSLFEKRRRKNALALLDSALKRSNREEIRLIYKSRLEVCQKLHDRQEILSCYNGLINNGERTAENFYERAVCHKKNGDKQNAVGDLEKAIDLGHPDAQKLYDRINPEKKRVIGYVTRCCDGSTSNATGRGACSHHGGVCQWNEPVYETYREY